ncbi:hypothetical protein SCOR_25740 [Sulfidibacter corallicola]|uniref:Uncharacterized protein n=1 Tax=Sulfidibacter corallicola TaxID=2818388 RepID=A0A8A4TRM6_SULCO|nr:hypothetical protein [Sulfidibacter corallicola]QTD52200.1 hypothetical protein J3U87_06980 [Sulfidibacter corallicola]
MRNSLWLAAVVLALILPACNRAEQMQKLELMRSFNNFIHSVNELHDKGLTISVYFPGVSDYKAHVKKLLLSYMERTHAGGPLEFDPQGVVLVRFLGLAYHRYDIKSYTFGDDGQTVQMRLSVSFSYDNNIQYSEYEEGTKVYIPAKPWGTVHEVVVGSSANPVPREQLSYLEIDVTMRKTNFEGYWQVRSCEVDESSLQFETSFRGDF